MTGDTTMEKAQKISTPYGKNHPTELPETMIERELVHKRQISLSGHVRSDGKYDIEAELTDHKTYPFPSDFRGTVTPDLPIHHMKLRITITNEFIITQAKAITISGPYSACPNANDIFTELIGVQIGPGWRKNVLKRIGGKRGCTHITELMGPIATVAYQTLYGQETRQRRKTKANNESDKRNYQSKLIDTCVAYTKDPIPDS